MKKDKRLQEYADKTMEQYKNNDLLHKLLAMQESKRKENVKFYKTKLFKTACVSFASIVLVVAITLCAIFLPPKGNDDEDLPPVNNEQSQGGDIPTLPQEPIVPPVTACGENAPKNMLRNALGICCLHINITSIPSKT